MFVVLSRSFIHPYRKTVRLAAAMLQKVVDSLAPALTSMLVRGKEVRANPFKCRLE